MCMCVCMIESLGVCVCMCVGGEGWGGVQFEKIPNFLQENCCSTARISSVYKAFSLDNTVEQNSVQKTCSKKSVEQNCIISCSKTSVAEVSTKLTSLTTILLI